MPDTEWATAQGLRHEKGAISSDRTTEGRLPFDPTGTIVPERLALALMLVPLMVVRSPRRISPASSWPAAWRARGEIGVRLALGASRGRVARQMITESLLLSLCGAAAAILLSRAFLTVFATYMPRIAGVMPTKTPVPTPSARVNRSTRPSSGTSRETAARLNTPMPPHRGTRDGRAYPQPKVARSFSRQSGGKPHPSTSETVPTRWVVNAAARRAQYSRPGFPSRIAIFNSHTRGQPGTAESEAEEAESMSLDVEAHSESHAHKTGHNWVDMTVALSALFLSIVSLGVAILHGRTMERMAEANARLVAANSWPFLSYGAGTVTIDGVLRVQMKVANSGIGPAKIESAELVWNGVAYRRDQDFLQACCNFDPDSRAAFDSDLVPAQVLRAGDQIRFLEFTHPASPAVFAALQRAMVSRDLQLNVCYCSIFDECWKGDLTTLSLKPEPVQACAQPKVPFDQGIFKGKT